MGFIAVLVAAVAGYAFGTVWYMSLSKPWMAAAGVKVGDDGRPVNSKDPIPYVTAFIMAVLVAGMMRHVFVMSGIDTEAKGSSPGSVLACSSPRPGSSTT